MNLKDIINYLSDPSNWQRFVDFVTNMQNMDQLSTDTTTSILEKAIIFGILQGIASGTGHFVELILKTPLLLSEVTIKLISPSLLGINLDDVAGISTSSNNLGLVHELFSAFDNYRREASPLDTSSSYEIMFVSDKRNLLNYSDYLDKWLAYFYELSWANYKGDYSYFYPDPVDDWGATLETLYSKYNNNSDYFLGKKWADSPATLVAYESYDPEKELLVSKESPFAPIKKAISLADNLVVTDEEILAGGPIVSKVETSRVTSELSNSVVAGFEANREAKTGLHFADWLTHRMLSRKNVGIVYKHIPHLTRIGYKCPPPHPEGADWELD